MNLNAHYVNLMIEQAAAGSAERAQYLKAEIVFWESICSSDHGVFGKGSSPTKGLARADAAAVTLTKLTQRLTQASKSKKARII
jgi:hypothetical protein